MWFHTSFIASTALLLSSSVLADDLYTKNSPILRLNAVTYEKQIASSNHTSIVEFYAPWCGHCQKLKPAFEKVAKNLKGLAKVAGINCDEDKNKPFCGQMGVKGFPTLKIIRPSKRGGRPIVEDYQGERTAKAIVNAVVEKIPNHVKRLTETSFEPWLTEKNDTAKAILFTEKGTVSALWRALAIDYLSVVNFGQIRNKEKDLVSMFGIEKFPTFVLLPGGDKEAVKYEGDIKKEPMIEFLKQVAEPNPDPPKGKAKPKSTKKPASDKKKKEEKAAEKKQEKTQEKKEEDEEKVAKPTEIKEEKIDEKTEQEKTHPYGQTTEENLREKCFTTTSGVCALVLLPSSTKPAGEEGSFSEDTAHTLMVLTEIYKKHANRQGKLKGGLQFHVLDNALELTGDLRSKLGLEPETLEIIAVNSKRLWYRKYPKTTYDYQDVDAWVDAIKMGEGSKEKLPETLVTEAESKKVENEEEKKAEEEKERERDEL